MAPIVELPSSGTLQRCSAVVGGYVVRDPTLVDWFGKYLFTDFCDGVFRIVDLHASNPKPRLSRLQVPWTASFGEGADGRLYVVAFLTGKVYRLESTG